MRFRVMNGKTVEIVSNERMLKMFEEGLELAKGLDEVLYVSSTEYQRKKVQLEKIESKETLTPRLIAEDIYRDYIHLQRRYHTIWKELSIRNIERY